LTGGSNFLYRTDMASRSYIINGFNDGLAAKYGETNAYSDSSLMPFLSEKDIPLASQTVLFGEKFSFASDFFMDYFDIDDGLKLDQVKHNHSTINTNLGGSVYGFIDGSVVFMKFGKTFDPQNLWATVPSDRTNVIAGL
jgi:hypothetical protein